MERGGGRWENCYKFQPWGGGGGGGWWAEVGWGSRGLSNRFQNPEIVFG